MNKMLHQLQSYDFALQEATLFLNSHPNDQQALAYYNEMQACSQELTRQYENQYGPLTNKTNSGSEWDYIHGKWPWEGED